LALAEVKLLGRTSPGNQPESTVRKNLQRAQVTSVKLRTRNQHKWEYL
jgi:hypothetical protein